jgi:hypothetical protein
MACTVPLFQARAYTFMGNSPRVWPDGNVSIVLRLGAAGRTLTDGNSSWDDVAAQALLTWNRCLGTIQFVPTTQSPGPGIDGDTLSQVFFNSTVYGQYFGKAVLSVTTSWNKGSTRIESDVIFNTAITWDSYRGPLRYPDGQLSCDLRRVALHEFGHVLGLDHPNEDRQTVDALMNSVTSDLDHLTADDIDGAQALYPPQAPVIAIQPQTHTAALGEPVTFYVVATSFLPVSYQWRREGGEIEGATNASYTIAEVEPNHAGNYTVAVSNAAGSVTSATAVLSVIAPATAATLNITRSGETVVVTWPASSIGYALEFAETPADAMPWQPMLLTPASVGDQYIIRVVPSGQSRFYRLKAPEVIINSR